MKKIKSLFKRNYGGDRLVYDEVVPSSEWVLSGEGIATIKFDGTACKVKDGKLFKRFDRKLTKGARRRHFNREGNRITEGDIPEADYKVAPANWNSCKDAPNTHTSHWPGWVPVTDSPADKWHREAWGMYVYGIENGTYELVGPKINGNPHELEHHQFWRHGIPFDHPYDEEVPRTFAELKEWFLTHIVEGIVWWHDDGRMVKIKRRDFGLLWPEKED